MQGLPLRYLIGINQFAVHTNLPAGQHPRPALCLRPSGSQRYVKMATAAADRGRSNWRPPHSPSTPPPLLSPYFPLLLSLLLPRPTLPALTQHPVGPSVSQAEGGANRFRGCGMRELVGWEDACEGVKDDGRRLDVGGTKPKCNPVSVCLSRRSRVLSSVSGESFDGYLTAAGRLFSRPDKRRVLSGVQVNQTRAKIDLRTWK
ncbi:hypothetical protein DPEC_G00112370 [Dallia pectoralis]|uniref:Uncharacterized protein n=1 Tax=Dallia pectoralis TaxID=75939 RepID=A0ACC2GU00_DALPE|nr:hypothetical protein DPEC_G00112370 [Dallia pectoralis]